jgi:hypothetical protein
MIPRLESSTLLAMILSARSLAKEGRLAEGYTHLAKGLHHAEELARRGAPWGSQLAAHYRKAVNHYLTRYGIHWDEPAGVTGRSTFCGGKRRRNA